ncbi:MAG: hypothetical protein J6K32_06230 [Clostridia bacterium]|nr:hypothetical protein [Clostridia bacterium]
MNHRNMYRMLCAMAAAMLMTAAACAAQAETLTCIVADGQYVNVRNRPSQSAATWGILHNGDTIDTAPEEIEKGYFRTTFNGHEAYVSVRYFEIAEERAYTVEANGRVRLRKAPGGAADGFVQPGSRVYVSAWRYAADGSRWARCTGGQYISADCLKAMQ